MYMNDARESFSAYFALPRGSVKLGASYKGFQKLNGHRQKLSKIQINEIA